MQRLPATRMLVQDALESWASEDEQLACPAPGHALANVGLTLDLTGHPAGSSSRRIVVDPSMTRAAYPKLPGKLAPHYCFRMPLERPRTAQHPSAIWLSHQDSRYTCGFSDADELRMQVEVLRQELHGFRVSVCEALDALCHGMERSLAASDAADKGLNQMALALEDAGLSFHSVLKSWRLPRAGALLITNPAALVRTYPHLAFFEPERFKHVLIIDRPERAGREVNQGLLF